MSVLGCVCGVVKISGVADPPAQYITANIKREARIPSPINKTNALKNVFLKSAGVLNFVTEAATQKKTKGMTVVKIKFKKRSPIGLR